MQRRKILRLLTAVETQNLCRCWSPDLQPLDQTCFANDDVGQATNIGGGDQYRRWRRKILRLYKIVLLLK